MPSTSAEGAAVYIIAPEDGSVVQSGAVTVRFGLSGMGVAPAGLEFDNSGHHHLLVNAEELPPLDMPIPTDSVHLHFGLGQTETTLDLSPGTYTLQMVSGGLCPYSTRSSQWCQNRSRLRLSSITVGYSVRL